MKKNIFRYGSVSLIIILCTLVGNYGCKRTRIKEVETNLGITIPSWTRVNRISNSNGQDYVEELTLKLTENGLNDLVKQIEQTKYFNLNHTFYGSNTIEWHKSDTVFYYNMIDYLKDSHLTGYWIKTDSSTIVFHEPDFGDIPNSAILFHEAYEIEAELFISEKQLIYRYIKF